MNTSALLDWAETQPGIVQTQDLLAMLKQLNFPTPVRLHFEDQRMPHMYVDDIRQEPERFKNVS